MPRVELAKENNKENNNANNNNKRNYAQRRFLYNNSFLEDQCLYLEYYRSTN